MLAGAAGLRATLRWRPEWPFAAAAALAWALMVAGSAGASVGVRTAGAFVCTIALAPGANPIALGGLGGWGVMSTAMMLPVTLPWMRWVGLNSLRGRRLMAMALYGAGFLAVWLAIGAVELGAASLLARLGLERSASIGLALLLAGAWEFSRPKRLALVRCHRTVALAPIGRRANAACLEFGARRGMTCAVSCWALMFVVAVVGPTQLALMAGLTALAVAQERTIAGWRLRPASGAALIAAAVLGLSGALVF